MTELLLLPIFEDLMKAEMLGKEKNTKVTVTTTKKKKKSKKKKKKRRKRKKCV